MLSPFLKGTHQFAESIREILPNFQLDCAHFVEACSTSLEATQLLNILSFFEFNCIFAFSLGTKTRTNRAVDHEVEGRALILQGVNTKLIAIPPTTFEYLRIFDVGLRFII